MHDAVNLVYKKNIRNAEGTDNDGLIVLTLESNCYAVFLEWYQLNEETEDFDTKRGIIAIFNRHERDKAQEYAIDAGRKPLEELKALPRMDYTR